MDNTDNIRSVIKQLLHPQHWRLWLLLVIFLVLTLIPLFVYKPDIESLKSLGYVGFFIANYFGWGVYMLPLLVTRLNPIILIIIGAFGSTIDEFVTWSLGKNAQHIQTHFSLQHKLERLIGTYGVLVIFIMGILPSPGIVTNVMAIICGHFGIPFLKYFAAAVAGRLISRTLLTYGFLHILTTYPVHELVPFTR